MKQIRHHLLLFILCFTVSGLIWSVAQPAAPDDRVEVDPLQLQKLQMAEVAIANLYVDSVDHAKLVEDAITGMLSKLDPHSSYTSAKETKKLNEPLEGKFEGIGVQFNMLQDTLVVIQTVKKGPSEKVGILSGDRIVRVDTINIAGVKMSRDSIMSLLRGKKDTKVRLTIVRRGAVSPLEFTVTRDKIPLNTLDAAYMIAPKVGYIHLGSFGATSNDEVAKAIKDLKKQGMTKLIFDLQTNGGGYLGAATQIASQFLQQGQLVVYTEGRSQRPERFTAQAGGQFTSGALAILTNEYTASAAEIVSGAVQDHDRGMIIGRRTFGKGLVQRPLSLPDGSMIRLTTAHYYTPSGRCIQKPYVKGDRKDYDMDVVNRLNHGELTSIDSIHLDSTKVYKTDLGRTVYGGGGIMPDIFVPADTSRYTAFYTALSRQNIIREQSLRYIDQHRNQLRKKYATFADFNQHFEVPQALVDTVVSVGLKKGIKPKDDAELQKTLPDLRFTLKSLFIVDLWDTSEYFQFYNQRDATVKRALEWISRQPD